MTAARPQQPIRLYRHPLSGHCHRVELFLTLLGLPFENVQVDLLAGEQRSPAFLAKNPFGQVPVIEDGDVTLADSNAILVYLAKRYDPAGRWLPAAPIAAAEVQRWLSVAAGWLDAGPATARVQVLFGRPREAKPVELANRLFGILDAHLASRAFLTGAAPTIADLALYAYTSHAPEGGVSLADRRHVRAWLSRVEALPGFIGMVRSPDAPPLAAS
jgi:glutathione S-transferase